MDLRSGATVCIRRGFIFIAARAAKTLIIPVIGIGGVERVPLSTMCFCAVARRNTFPAMDVFLARNRFEMVRITTQPCAAKMIYIKMRRHWLSQQRVNQSVRAPRSSSKTYCAVALFFVAQAADPEPAAAVRLGNNFVFNVLGQPAPIHAGLFELVFWSQSHRWHHPQSPLRFFGNSPSCR